MLRDPWIRFQTETLLNGASQESGLSGLIDSFSSLGNDDTRPQQIRPYKVLVTEELERIHDTYFALWYQIVNPPNPLVIFNQVDIRR
ncbi:hypothetical protein PGTUg99_028779 [Puccinia graminis f. sp. tritici]|uniref:Uncharacterized protein n=1 Tax=Puccinia graminis f. sp. tritici TaxID=56615 RepID=A0A5B0RFZ8_PUCGR|nr:hypothetical protein PGTUg99_028779 [Puccinia graminis f. sp. tritici]